MNPTTKSKRTLRTTSPSKPSRPARARIAAPFARRDAWITDPCALLSALERAEHPKVQAEPRPEPVAEMCHMPLLDAPAPPSTPSIAPRPLAILRDDERIGHASQAGVVVIIRRRRAA